MGAGDGDSRLSRDPVDPKERAGDQFRAAYPRGALGLLALHGHSFFSLTAVPVFPARPLWIRERCPAGWSRPMRETAHWGHPRRCPYNEIYARDGTAPTACRLRRAFPVRRASPARLTGNAGHT